MWLTLTTAIFLTTISVCVTGHSGYRTSIPNGNNVQVDGASWPGVGHLASSGGGARNSFGLAFAAAGHAWTSDLCSADSDGDGYSNGMELGDPDCTWTTGGTPSRTTDISHPGIASSTPPTTTEATTSTAPTTTTTSPTTSTTTATTAPTTSTTTATTATTTTEATTSTTTAPTTTTTATPPTTSSGQGLTADVDILTGMKAGWGLCAGRSDTACGGSLSTASDQSSVLVTLQFPNSAGTWGAMGFAETSMVGNAVACALADLDVNHVVCMLYETISYGAVPKMAVSFISTYTPDTVVEGQSAFVIYSASANSDGIFVTFRIDASLLGINTTTTTSSSSSEVQYRAIFSQGSFNQTLLSDIWTSIDATTTKRITTFTRPIFKHTSRTAKYIAFTATTNTATSTTATTTSQTTTSTPSSGDGLTATFKVLTTLNAGWGLCAGRSDDACGGSLSTTSDQNSVLVTLQFSSDVGTWGAMGFSGTSMVGNAVACALADADVNRPVCILLQTFNYGVTAQRAVSMSSSSSANGGGLSTFVVYSTSKSSLGTFITFRIDRSLVDATDGEQRSIFAQGAFQSSSMSALWSSINQSGINSVSASISSPLSQHQDKGAALINLAAPNTFTVLGEDSSYVTSSYTIVIVTLVVIGLSAQFVYRVMDPLAGAGPISNMVAHGSMAAVLLLILPVTVLVLMKEHYAYSRDTAPWFRATGEVAKYGFFLVLLPVCHRISLPAIFLRTTYERSTGMHAALGIFILLAVTVHGIGMSLKGVESFSDITNPDTPKRNLFGLLAWIMLVLVSIPAMLRGSKILPRMFATFRITHLLVVFVIIFASIHNPNLILVMIPGLVMFMGDMVWRTYELFFINRKACVMAAEYNANAGVIAIQLTCRGVQRGALNEALVQAAGKHVLIRIQRLGPLPHPLSIALTDPTRGVVTLFIKNTGEDASRPLPLSHRWTERLAAMVTSSAQNLFAPEECDKNASQSRLFDAAVLGLLSSSAVVPLETLLGHHGITHAATTHIHIVLMAGGIGITPIISYLQALAGLATEERGEGCGVLRQLSVTVVWSVREDGMRAYFEPLLQQLVGGIGSHILFPSSLLPPCRSGGPAVMLVKSLSLHIFQTGGGGGALRDTSSSSASALAVSPEVEVAKVRKWSTRGGDKEEPLCASEDDHSHGSDVEMTDLVGNGGGNSMRNEASWFLPPKRIEHNSKAPSTEPINTTEHKGRPDLETLKTIVFDEGVGGNTTDAGAVYACGPSGVMSTAKELARKTGLLYHYEVFE